MGKSKERSDFIKEAKKIVELGEKRGVPLRLMGACAIAIHCSESSLALYDKLNRQLSDLDFMTNRKMDEVKRFLGEIGYKVRERFQALGVSGAVGMKRQIYVNEETGLHVDMFFEKLCMCHTIDFRDRMTVDYPTISLADLLLEKLQIVKIAEKDIIDVIILLREHDLGETDKDTLNCMYIAKLLSRDWGFYYTVTMNLKKIENKFLFAYTALSDKDKTNVKAKIENLLARIEAEPKSLNWRIRAKLGTKIKWYEEVEEITREPIC